MKLANKTASESDSLSFDHLQAQLVAAVEMETYVWSDELPDEVHSPLSVKVHRSVLKSLTEFSRRIAESGRRDARAMRADLKAHLAGKIDKMSLSLVQSASESYACLSSTPVQYFINCSNDRDVPEWEPFDFDEFPFIDGHAEMLAAAIRIRKEDSTQQLLALKFLHCKEELLSIEESMAMAEEDTPDDDLDAHLKNSQTKNESLLQTFESKLKERVRVAAEDFYGYIANGTSHPYAIPIEIGRALDSEDLRFIGKAYRHFGSAIRVPFQIKIEGAVAQRTAAIEARNRYDEIGHAFNVLSAWVIALESIDSHRKCAICYRHATVIKRCAIHATQTQETREARIGKLVSPHYKSCLDHLVHKPKVRTLLRTSLTWNPVASSDEFAHQLELLKLSSISARRAIVLANQLREIHPVLNADMADCMAQLFKHVLETVREIELLPPPVGDAQRRIRDHQVEIVHEILTMKGFFRAWCGQGLYSREVRIQMLGFDRGNPITKGAAFDGYAMRLLLLSQCAWEGELKAFMSNNMPTADQILESLKGSDMKAVAADFSIALSTAYKILKRGASPTKRSFFRSQ